MPNRRLYIKTSSHWDRNFHYKDKTVSRPSYLYNENIHTLKDCLYIETGPWVFAIWERPYMLSYLDPSFHSLYNWSRCRWVHVEQITFKVAVAHGCACSIQRLSAPWRVRCWPHPCALRHPVAGWFPPPSRASCTGWSWGSPWAGAWRRVWIGCDGSVWKACCPTKDGSTTRSPRKQRWVATIDFVVL